MTEAHPSEETLFHAAREIADPESREAYLRQACGGDTALFGRVEQLLRAAGDPGFLAAPATRILEDDTLDLRDAAIGPFRLLDLIGEGGMGRVYLAEQDHPVRRRVALKVVKAGMDSRQVLARFEAERQALALMDHPNIARVLDAGTTESGRPYFVMDLVEGTAITRFCDEQRLSIRERLALFMSVCDAVQHAHQKGIIHRDLKPSNVLVTMADGKPVAKVIDFGVAKAAGPRLTEETFQTEFGAVIGTPEYMSPEQAELNSLDVDTRSDIYSLGVLLYELLAGSPPLERAAGDLRPLLEVLRTIREAEWPRPSTRLGAAAEIDTIAARRGVEPAKLLGLVKGELDWIVMKCLDKDRSRRYGTASGLAADIQRYLNDEPVHACPPTRWYRLGKFARRNKLTLSVAATVAAALFFAVGSLAVAAARIDGALEDKTAAFDALKEEKQKTDDALGREKEALALIREEQVRTKRALSQHTIALSNREWGLNHPARSEELLDSVPMEFRRWEWHYLKRRCHRELLTLKGHTEPVELVVWSRDGERIITSAHDQSLRIWDARTGRQQRQITLPSGKVLDISRDGTRAVLSATKPPKTPVFVVIDTLSGKKTVVAPPKLPNPVKPLAAALSPDGGRLAIGTAPFSLTVFDLTNGKELYSIESEDLPLRPDPRRRPYRGVFRLTFSEDGKMLAGVLWGEPSTTFIWDAATGKPLPQGTRYAGLFQGLVFSPDGVRLAGLNNGEVTVVGARGGQAYLRLPRSDDDEPTTEGSTGLVAFSPDKRHVGAGGLDGTVRIWTLQGILTRVFRAHSKPVSAIAFSPDGGRVASASADHTVKVWDVVSGQDATVLTRGELNRFEGGLFIISPDARRFASGPPINKPDAPPLIRIWEDPDGDPLTINTGAKRVSSIHFSPDGSHLFATLEFPAAKGVARIVRLYDAKTGQVRFSTPECPPTELYQIELSGDGRHLLVLHRVGNESKVRFLDAASHQELASTRVPPQAMVGLQRASWDGRYLAVNFRPTSASRFEVWDLATADRVVFTIPRGDTTIMCSAFSRDGKTLATGTTEGVVTLWDANSGTKLQEFFAHYKSVIHIAFSPDGLRLATMDGSRRVKLWEPTGGRELLALPAVKEITTPGNLAFTPDGNRLLLVGVSGALVWDATPWEEPPG